MRVRVRILRPRPGGERGAVALIVVLSMFTILALVMLVIDVGGLLSMHRRVVRAADAAALAAAQTCARELAENPSTLADQYAEGNVSSTVQVDFSVSACGSASSGVVSLKYQAPQGLYFAQIFGWDDFTNVPARAHAIWGPAGTANVVPLMTSTPQFLGECGIPEAGEGVPCPFWYDFDALGDSTVGWLNLDRWDVAASSQCPNTGSSSLEDWLVGDDVPELPPLNWTDPTYVCAVSGNRDSNWEDLRDLINSGEKIVRLFPVNDADGSYSLINGGTGIHGQVDKDGNLAPPCPGSSCPKVDKYDIVGFLALELVALYDGDDPAAVGEAGFLGTPDLSGTCEHKKTPDFDNNESFTLDFASGTGCPNGVTPDTITPASPFVFDKSKVQGTEVITPYTQCPAPGPGCDYGWDPQDHEITWWGSNNTKNVHVAFDWFKAGEPAIPGTSGACGSNGEGPNGEKAQHLDKCLVTAWAGFTSEGGDPGQGADFGVRPVRLCEPPDPLCP